MQRRGLTAASDRLTVPVQATRLVIENDNDNGTAYSVHNSSKAGMDMYVVKCV